MPPAPPLRLLHVLQPSHSLHASISRRHPTAKPVNYTSHHNFTSEQLHEVEHATHLRLLIPTTFSRPRSARSSGAVGRSLQVTHWIHSANRRAGQPPRSLGAQHLANCPSIRLISRSPFSCARQFSRRLTASQSSGLVDRIRGCGAVEDWRRWRRAPARSGPAQLAPWRDRARQKEGHDRQTEHWT